MSPCCTWGHTHLLASPTELQHISWNQNSVSFTWTHFFPSGLHEKAQISWYFVHLSELSFSFDFPMQEKLVQTGTDYRLPLNPCVHVLVCRKCLFHILFYNICILAQTHPQYINHSVSVFIYVCGKICFWCWNAFIIAKDKQHLTSPKYSLMHTYAITITCSIRLLGLQPSRLSKGSLGAVKLSECGDLSPPQRPPPSISHKIYREANTGCDEDTAARQRQGQRKCVCMEIG